jgi:parallel beta-helix repeat protein
MGSLGKTYALLIVLVFITASVIFQPAPVKAASKTITVPNDFSNIQAAINHADAGDTVFVKNGTYNENLIIAKPIQLIGQNRDTTIIEGNLSTNTAILSSPLIGYGTPLTINQNNVTVEGFTISDSFAGIQVGGNNCTIYGNRITNVQYGITVFNSSGTSIIGNIIDSIKTNGCGIKVTHALENNIKQNRIISASIGIFLTDTLLSHTSLLFNQYNNISENTITNSSQDAIMLQYVISNFFVGNTISNSTVGLSIYVGYGNNFNSNNFINNSRQVSISEWYATQWGYISSTNTWNENYWSDYQSKYPNATEINNSGIGNTPYVIDANNVDHYPLLSQANTVTPTPLPTTVTTPTPTVPEFSWLAILPLLVLILSVAVVSRLRRKG